MTEHALIILVDSFPDHWTAICRCGFRTAHHEHKTFALEQFMNHIDGCPHENYRRHFGSENYCFDCAHYFVKAEQCSS